MPWKQRSTFCCQLCWATGNPRHPPGTRDPERDAGSEAGTGHLQLGAERWGRSLVGGWDSTCHFCFRVFSGDAECPFPNLHMEKIRVCICVCTQSQDGYYDLKNMKFMRELITYGYVCESECVYVRACTYIYIWLLDFSESVQNSKTLSHFHHEYTFAYGIKCLDCLIMKIWPHHYYVTTEKCHQHALLTWGGNYLFFHS